MAFSSLLLIAIISVIFLFILLVSVKPLLFSKNRIIVILSCLFLAGIIVFAFSGIQKLSRDLGRIIKNTGPKSPETIYSILFENPIENCVTTINLKDQVLPIIDCCIWMEIKLCPEELERILKIKKYEASIYSNADSVNFNNSFTEKPAWWKPQNIGDSFLKFTFRKDQNHVQTIFSGKDSTHIFICDLAN
ncbi:hypothetical protein [Flavihumibacter sp. UBA7668]|uniref:hypothetical protein n=1 Tax=Flavihumibacter sp. UBA7668 TaxID=1946542 RepID=UPI0025C1FDE4|nr:hypothetical protein [Flavihumibacter sp. UBA7668]